MSSSQQTDRTARYRDIISPEVLLNESPIIIGTGAIGRQVALQLAAIGVGEISLWDFDSVSPVNMGTQGWSPDQLGKPKVHALRDDLQRINPSLHVNCFNEPWTFIKYLPAFPIFACPDSIEVRRHLWDTKPVAMFDARMAALAFQIYSVYNEDTRARYQDTLFPPEEAFPVPCTQKATLFCASMAASFLVSHFILYLRQMSPPFYVSGSLISSTVTVASE